MTLDETIDRIESDLFEIDMIDMQSAADKERRDYMNAMKRWLKAAKDKYEEATVGNTNMR